MGGRHPVVCDDWREVFLNPVEAASSRNCSESLGRGHSVIEIHKLLSVKECEFLIEEATQVGISSQRQADQFSAGRVRLPIRDTLKAATQERCDDILVRALAWLETNLPLLRKALFGDVSLQSCIRNPGLTFACGEPALNVYLAGERKSFKRHFNTDERCFLTLA